MAYNKVVYGENVLIDLTDDTITAAKLITGETAHDASGAAITGTFAGVDSSDATATAGNILSGKSAYVGNVKVNGSMTDNGAVSGTISTKAGVYTPPAGYHSGAGSVAISAVEQAKLIAGNIKAGTTILGVQGSFAGGITYSEADNAAGGKTATFTVA